MADIPNITPEVAQQFRQDYAAQYVPPHGATPEQVEAGRTVWLSKFDAALALDNVALPTAADQAAEAKATAHGIAHAPDPAGYKIELPHQLVNSLRTEKLVAIDSEMRTWAAASAVPKEIATGLLSRLGEVGQEVAALDDAGRVLWHDRNRALMRGVLGQEGYDTAIADARYALEIATGPAASFSKTIAGSLALYDPVVLQALSYLGRQHRAWRDAK